MVYLRIWGQTMEFEDNSLTNHGWIEHDNIDNGIYIYMDITDNGI